MLGPPQPECRQCQCQWEARRRLSEPGSPTTSADSRSLQSRYWLVYVQCRRLSRCTPDHTPISSWANYLRHVRPHAVKPLSCKRALVAHPLDLDLPGRSFVPYRVDVLGGPERITEFLVTIRLFDGHDVRVLLDAPHASDALVLQRFESAKVASKDPVDARPAKHNFLVQPVFEGLVNKHSCEAQLASAHVKLVRNLIDVRSRLWLYLETLVACFFHSVPPRSICTNRD